MNEGGPSSASAKALASLSQALRDRLGELFDLAIAEARRGDDPFGCVLADRESGEVVVAAGNSAFGDATAHAEINALRRLAETKVDPARIALISTAEPCPLCASGIWWTGIDAVVFGTPIERLIRFGWSQIRIRTREVFDRGTPERAIALVEEYDPGKCDPLYASGPSPRRADSGR